MKEKYKIEKSWEGPFDKLPSCRYNFHVGCGKGDCENCGWNPFVSLYRITSKYGIDAGDYLTRPNS